MARSVMAADVAGAAPRDTGDEQGDAEALGERIALLTALERDLRAAFLAAHEQLYERDGEIQRLRENEERLLWEIDRQAALATNLQAILADQVRHIATQEAHITAQEAHIAAQEQHITEQEEHIAAQSRSLDSLYAFIIEQQTVLDEARALLVAQGDAFTREQVANATLRAEVRALRADGASQQQIKEEHVRSLETYIAHLETTVVEKERHAEELRGRITAARGGAPFPLSLVAALVRGVRGAAR